jgi:hypothetical protein
MLSDLECSLLFLEFILLPHLNLNCMTEPSSVYGKDCILWTFVNLYMLTSIYTIMLSITKLLADAKLPLCWLAGEKC